jgi:hypothetical protein
LRATAIQSPAAGRLQAHTVRYCHLANGFDGIGSFQVIISASLDKTSLRIAIIAVSLRLDTNMCSPLECICRGLHGGLAGYTIGLHLTSTRFTVALLDKINKSLCRLKTNECQASFTVVSVVESPHLEKARASSLVLYQC